MRASARWKLGVVRLGWRGDLTDHPTDVTTGLPDRLGTPRCITVPGSPQRDGHYRSLGSLQCPRLAIIERRAAIRPFRRADRPFPAPDPRARASMMPSERASRRRPTRSPGPWPVEPPRRPLVFNDCEQASRHGQRKPTLSLGDGVGGVVGGDDDALGLLEGNVTAQPHERQLLVRSRGQSCASDRIAVDEE